MIATDTGFATLPMYDWPEMREATDGLWTALRKRLTIAGIDTAPDLVRDEPVWDAWRHPALVLGQTCGLPYVTGLKEHVRYVGTPHYAVPGCTGPRYTSAIITRAGDERDPAAYAGGLAAINDEGSQSGHAALRAVVAPHARQGHFFSRVITTGSHRASIRAVAEGRADIAAIDAVCWALAGDHEPDRVAELQAIAWSPPTPGLPFICAGAVDDRTLGAVQQALAETLSDPAIAGLRRVLHLEGFSVLDPAVYDALLAMEEADRARDYPRVM